MNENLQDLTQISSIQYPVTKVKSDLKWTKIYYWLFRTVFWYNTKYNLSPLWSEAKEFPVSDFQQQESSIPGKKPFVFI